MKVCGLCHPTAEVGREVRPRDCKELGDWEGIGPFLFPLHALGKSIASLS